MLCESRLWCEAFFSNSEFEDPEVPQPVSSPLLASRVSKQPQGLVQSSHRNYSLPQFQDGESQHYSLAPMQSSPVMGIPGRDPSLEAEAFLVPSSCQSICQHYSDLHIAGGQVLPLSPKTDDHQGSLLQDTNPGPFLLSRDVPPPSILPPLIPKRRSSRRWREGSGREQGGGPSLLQDGRPLSNSELNGYLEQKLLELYTEYLTEGPIMVSELEEITLQLSREYNLETALAKDMLLSCLMKATSSNQSSEISTPLLQISTQTK